MKYFTFLLLLLQSVCYSQNLVPNGGFEEHTGCPTGYPDLEGVCNDWHSYAGSCDYINVCSDVCGYHNAWGFQEPHGGEAYCDFLAYYRFSPNIREHLGCKLNDTLQVGQKYFFSMYVCNSWKAGATNIACNQIGFLFRTSPYSIQDISSSLNNTSTFSTENIISDTINWTHISSSFVADSAYSHIIVGNFFDDNHTDTLNHQSQLLNQVAMYYVDDICVSTDSNYCDGWTGMKEPEFRTIPSFPFPNPATELINYLNNARYSYYQISDCLGRTIISGNFSGKTLETISIKELALGTYYLKLFSRAEKYTYQIVKTE